MSSQASSVAANPLEEQALYQKRKHITSETIHGNVYYERKKKSDYKQGLPAAMAACMLAKKSIKALGGFPSGPKGSGGNAPKGSGGNEGGFGPEPAIGGGRRAGVIRSTGAGTGAVAVGPEGKSSGCLRRYSS